MNQKKLPAHGVFLPRQTNLLNLQEDFHNTSNFKSTMLLCPLESTTNCGVKFAYFFKRDFLLIIAPSYFTIRLPLCHHEAPSLINQFVLGMMNEESHILSLKNRAESGYLPWPLVDKLFSSSNGN